MIARLWRGRTRAADAGRYRDYLGRTGVAAFAATPGNRGAYVLQRETGDEAEFLVVSLWEDMAAVRAFAGSDPDRAVFYPEDEDFLTARELTVTHYDVTVSLPSEPAP